MTSDDEFAKIVKNYGETPEGCNWDGAACPNDPACEHPGYMHLLAPRTLRVVCTVSSASYDEQRRRSTAESCTCGR
jgi:hypothetical protein